MICQGWLVSLLYDNLCKGVKKGSMGVEKPIGFSTGREYDKETGLYHNGYRYYDPMEGRFISKDPIEFKGGDANLYGYVGNNPINVTDPEGLSPTPLPPGRTRFRYCNSDEAAACKATCGCRGMESCRVSQTWQLTRYKGGLSKWEWVDGPMSCSCNDPEDFLNRFKNWLMGPSPFPKPSPLPGLPGPVPVPIPVIP